MTARLRRKLFRLVTHVGIVTLLALIAPKPTGAEPGAQTVLVMVPEHSPPLPLARLTAALQSQLAELGIEVQVSAGPPTLPAPGGPASHSDAGADATAPTPETPETPSAATTHARNVLAVIWIERVGDALVVHFYEPAGSSLRERRIPVTGTDAASIEEVAVIVRSAVSAMLERRQRDAAPPPKSKQPPHPEPPSEPIPDAEPEAPDVTLPWLRWSLGYTTTRYGHQTDWQHGARADVTWWPSSRWALGLGYTWFPTLEHDTDLLTLQIDRHPVELSLTYEFLLGGSDWRLTPEAALIADPITRRTSQSTADLTSTAAATRWSWAVSTRLRLGWHFLAPFSLFAAGGADALLNRFDHVIDGAESADALSQARIRPHFSVGAAIHLP